MTGGRCNKLVTFNKKTYQRDKTTFKTMCMIVFMYSFFNGKINYGGLKVLPHTRSKLFLGPLKLIPYP